MTSRHPSSILSSSKQPPTASGAQPSHLSAPGEASENTAYEDTPIISRVSTPRSYQSTDNVTTNSSSSSSVSMASRERRRERNHDGGSDTTEEEQQQTQPRPSHQNGSLNDQSDDRAWHKKTADKYGSLELENKGSVARDHLALERTFLAWLRTSLAFASIGIAITQLFRLNTAISPESTNTGSSALSASNHDNDNDRPFSPILPPVDHSSIFSSSSTVSTAANFDRLRGLGKPLGATFIGIAIAVLLVGFHRYFESQYWVVRGKFPASRGSIALVAFCTGALMVSSLVLILTIAPGAWDS